MKIDLHNHLLIGFQPYWREQQGYFGKNLAKLLADTAMRKDIGLTAITSENFEIPKGSYHDRFGEICKDAADLESESYSIKRIGENILRIDEKDYTPGRGSMEQFTDRKRKSVYIINGQTVIVNEDGKRYDHLVFGSNQVPNGNDWDYTLKYCRDNHLMNFLEHPAAETHLGIGITKSEELLNEYGDIITGIEGHNGSLIWNLSLNQKAKELAKKFNKPYIATSDAHSPDQVGAANIETEDNLEFLKESEIFSYLNRTVKNKTYSCNENYVSTYSWIKNAAAFVIGTKVFGMGKR